MLPTVAAAFQAASVPCCQPSGAGARALRCGDSLRAAGSRPHPDAPGDARRHKRWLCRGCAPILR